MSLMHYLDEIHNLNTSQYSDGSPKPHKPIMLLSIISLIESGEITSNCIHFSQSLVEQFSKYFNLIKRESDWCQPGPPFFHLRSSSFWHHQILPGRESEYSKITTSGGGNKRIIENVDYAYLDDELFDYLIQEEKREKLKQELISTYFSKGQQKILISELFQEKDSIEYQKYILENKNQIKETVYSKKIRDAAFRRLVLNIYNRKCVLCGFSFLYPEVPSPIDAAHIIPWSISYNDHPSNGLSLCKNCHWAFDSNLFAILDDYTLAISKIFIQYELGNSNISKFNRKKIQLPKNMEFWPSKESIRYSQKQLLR